jgi:hypothetical protein
MECTARAIAALCNAGHGLSARLPAQPTPSRATLQRCHVISHVKYPRALLRPIRIGEDMSCDDVAAAQRASPERRGANGMAIASWRMNVTQEEIS